MPQFHRLTPMLSPASIALVGGSPRAGTVGNRMIHCLREGGFPGAMTVVNPRYESVEGLPCVAAMSELVAPPDLAILSVAAHRMERTMAEAIEAGARSAVIFDPCFFEADTEPRLLDRLKAMAREADFPVCGGNGMGFLNYDSRTLVSFVTPESTTPGHIAAFCHSGSVFGILAFADPRHRFNLLTSQGQEIGASVAEYMDYALDQPTTRVLVLFLEAVRDPERFVAALEKANRLGVPVVATKVGRTPQSAALAVTHSGALAGDDGAFDAVCRRYGVLRTDDLDTMMSTAQILAVTHELGEGGLAAILDSGGLREQMMDLAHDLGIGFATLTPQTVERLRSRLPYGLSPVNPLDAAGPVNDDYESVIVDALHLLDADPNVAMVVHELYATDTRVVFTPRVVAAAKAMPRRSRKPYVVTYSMSTVRNSVFATDLLDSEVPLINGVRPLLVGVGNAFVYRDFRRRAVDEPPEVGGEALERWRERLGSGAPMGESEGLAMLRELGVPAVPSKVVGSADEAVSAATELGYPVVLKTAAPGVIHKTEIAGVHVDLTNEAQVREAYRGVSVHSPLACVAAMASLGVELAFGLLNDPQFGPVIMVGAGGVLVELLADRRFLLAPFGPQEARRQLETLDVFSVLRGARGSTASDLDALCAALSRFSAIGAALGAGVEEMDVNPVIAGPGGAVAVDCVVVLRS